jgi:festuclavine dehydrogenase
MAILLIGGAGKTGSGIARSLQDANIPFLLGSRREKDGAPAGMPAVSFDWFDASTWDNPFQYKFPNGEILIAVYMIAPRTNDPDALIISFVDRAVKHGVKRFVVLGGTSTQLGGAALLGRAWQYLIDIGAEYCILRPTWFMGMLPLIYFYLALCIVSLANKVVGL